MKEYRTNEELINYLESKGINILDKEDVIQKIERYTYYSIKSFRKSLEILKILSFFVIF